MYRMLYTAIPVGSYLQRLGSFAESPVLTWDSLDEAKQYADWQHSTVVTGWYTVINEAGKPVYTTKNQPYQ